ncbi:MAG: PadR family transcriptional regulator [Pseudomonadota bacterium]
MRHHRKRHCQSRRAMMRGPGPHRRGRGRRPLGHGDLRLLLLDLIAAEPTHGYGLIGLIETRTGGLYAPSPGVIYPALELLQDQGFAEAKVEDGKKILYITEEGRAHLEDEATTIAAIQARLDELAGKSEPDPDDIRGAMRQLRNTVMRAAVKAGDNAEAREALAVRINELRASIEGDSTA